MEPQLLNHAQVEEFHSKIYGNIEAEASTSTAGVVARVADSTVASPEGKSSGEGHDDRGLKEENGFHVVDVKNDEEHSRKEKICRICHMSDEQSSPGNSELIQLGCHCREELGISHRVCAEKWFKQRGNRLCEICNKTAKNVRLIKETRIYVAEFNEMRPMPATSLDFPRDDGSRRCKQSCNFLLACLVLALIVSTCLRVKVL